MSLLIFPVICIFLSIFAWTVTFIYPTVPRKALVISVLITLPFIAVGLIFTNHLDNILFLSNFALGPLAAVFITYALFQKLEYAGSSYAWLKAIGLFLVCALGIFLLFLAGMIISVAHSGAEPISH